MVIGVPLSLQPVINRLGEWLRAASYNHHYFAAIESVIYAINPDGAAVRRIQELWCIHNMKNDFHTIHENYCIIEEAITSSKT